MGIDISPATLAARTLNFKVGAPAGFIRVIGTSRLYTNPLFPGLLFKYHSQLSDLVEDCSGIAFQTWNGSTLSPTIHVAIGAHAKMIFERNFAPNPSGNWALGGAYSDVNLELVRDQAYMALDNTVFDWDHYSKRSTKSTRMLAPVGGYWPQGGRDFYVGAAGCELRNVMGVVNQADFGYVSSQPSMPGVSHVLPALEGVPLIYGQIGTRVVLGHAGKVLKGEKRLFLEGASSLIRPFIDRAVDIVAAIYWDIPLLATVGTQWETGLGGTKVTSGFTLPSLCAVDRASNPQDIFIPSQNPDRPFSVMRMVTINSVEVSAKVLTSTVTKHRLASAYDWPTGRVLPIGLTAHRSGSVAKIFGLLKEAARFVDTGLDTSTYNGDPETFNHSLSNRRGEAKEVQQWASSYYGHPMIAMLQNMSQRVYDTAEELARQSV